MQSTTQIAAGRNSDLERGAIAPTPGPWKWHTHDHERWRIYGTADMHDGPVEGCYVVADVVNGNGYAQNLANRDLIVAAPDLLKGAEHLMAYEQAMDADDHIAAMHHYAEAVDILRAAISRATHTA